MKTLRWLFLTLSAALLGVSVMGCGPHQIPPATVGIIFDGSSGVSQQVLKPRIVWTGWYQRLITYPTSIRNATYVRNGKEGDKEGDDSIKATTKEGAVLPMDVTLAYSVQPGDVVKAFTKFGTENIEAVQLDYLRWAVIYATNVVSGNHSIFDLISKDRAHIGPEVKAVIAPILADWGITVDQVYVGEVYPSKEINDKIAESISVRNELEKAKIDVRQARIEAGTILTNANRVAEQNRLLANQGQKSVKLRRLALRKVLAEKWDGESQIVGDGTVPFTGMKPN